MTLQVVDHISTQLHLPDLAESALNPDSQVKDLYQKMTKKKQYSRQGSNQIWKWMLIRSTNFYFCRKSCKRAKNDHTVIGKPKCGQLSLSERELFERSNVSLLEQCEVSSYPQILLLQSERLFHGELQSRLVK